MPLIRRSIHLLRCITWALAIAVSQALAWDQTQGLVLKGDVVTMDSAMTVIPDGRVVIRGERILAVLKPGESMPESLHLTNAVTLDTDGFIFPGLIDAHNHTEYNMLPLWQVPKRYDNRDQWRSAKQYKRDITQPKTLLTESKYLNLSAQVVKYAEVKSLLGGQTAVQGSPNLKALRHMVRNIEGANFGQDRIYAYTLSISDARLQKGLESGLLRLMDQGLVDAWIVHLAEGVDAKSRREFATLKRLGLLRDQTVIVHGTALAKVDFEEMAQAGAKLIWSPLSNLLLYGGTTDIPAALASGVLVCLGADWSPSGSKNLLGELKVAHEYDLLRWGRVISDQELVRMVTLNPSIALGLDDKIGRIKAGYYADLAVFRKRGTDPYRSLIESIERDVRLVIVGGMPYYGDRALLAAVKGEDLEVLHVQGVEKGIDITDPSVPMGDESLSVIQGQLAKALLLETGLLRAGLRTELDEGQFEQFLRKQFPGLQPIALDPLLPDEAFFEVLRQSTIANLGFDLAKYWTRSPEADEGEARLLDLLNGPESTFEFLDQEVGLNRRAARSIIQQRAGEDGIAGSTDDRPIRSISGLDRLPYVGPSTLELLRRYVASQLN